MHTYKGVEQGHCVKTQSLLVAKGFSQVAGVAVKMIAAVANEKRLPVYYLDVSQVFVQAHLKEEIFMRLPPGCDELAGKSVQLLKCQYALNQNGREWYILHITGKLANEMYWSRTVQGRAVCSSADS